MAFIQIKRKFTGFSSYTDVIVYSEVSGGFEEPEAGLTNPAFLHHFSSHRSAGWKVTHETCAVKLHSGNMSKRWYCQ